MNVTRQPLLIALPTLVLVLVALLVRKQGLSFAPEAAAVVRTLPELWITQFQQLFPKVAWTLWVLLHLATAITLGRMGLRHGLYAGNTLLALPLYGLVACGLFVADDYLMGALCAFFLARAMRNFSTSYRSGYAFSSLFRGSLYLGMLLCLYAPALPLFLLAPLVTFLFKRTLREWLVLFCGLFFPFAALCYLHWAISAQPWEPLFAMQQVLFSPLRLNLFAEASPVLIVQLVVLLSATLCALFYYLSDIYAATSKARAILTAHVWLFLLVALTLIMPAATVNSLTLVAVPVSIILPFLFARIKPSIANALYAILFLLFILHLFF